MAANPQPEQVMTGSELQQLRESLFLTQKDFAARIGTTQSHLSRLEAGEKRISPETATAVKTLIANALPLPSKCGAKNCGKVFIPSGNRRKFCSPACAKRESQRLYVERHPKKVLKQHRNWHRRNRIYGDNGKLAEVVAEMIQQPHLCGPQCGCGKLQHLKVVADRRQKARESKAKYTAEHLQEVREKNRKRIAAERAAHPKKYRKYRREHYAANRDRILPKRRAKEGSIPREQFLEIMRSLPKVASGHTANGAKGDTRGKSRGRKPERVENRTFYRYGSQVENLLPASRKNDKYAIIEVRRQVAEATGLPQDLIAEYHRKFRRTLGRN